MNEKEIQKLLVSDNFSQNKTNYKCVLPNVFFYAWESDLLTVNKSDLIYEFEIKISRWDYKKDFEKVDKHKKFSRIDNLSAIPNRFYYACPEGLINIDDVPEYAGLIYIEKFNMKKYTKIIKKAPLLHHECISDDQWQQLAIKLSHKLF